MAGNVLGGRYTVQDRIGTGGMAIVYRGLDNVLGRTVAIKTMLPQYANDPSFAARFKQEAQAAAALQSPYIVSVYDWGKDGDTYFIVMEYLRGTDLKSGIKKHGALDGRKVAQIGSQISQALSVAHKHDIIHRDIKPQNIMVQPDGNIKVMDFGIARAKNSHLTQDNNVLGTAHYVSPEQTQGKELGPTSDIYSLGIVMYEAATGEVPFKGDDAISVALKQVSEQPVPPSQINPNVDPQLEGIILKCMQKDPAARFQTADELARVLRDYLAGRMAAVTNATAVLGAAADSTQAMNIATPLIPADARERIANNQNRRGNGESALAEAEQRARSRKRKIIVGVVALLAVVAAIVGGVIASNATGKTQAVPNLRSLTEDQALQQIEDSDFFEKGTVKEQYSSSVEKGHVIDQDPEAGKQVTKGTRINLVVSKGAEPAATVTVPNLKNMTPSDAEKALSEKGLKAQAGDSVYSDEVENGKVCGQSVAAGSSAKAGDTIIYQISLGSEQLNVPEGYEGATLADLEAAINDAKLNVGNVSYQYSDTVAEGSVISYSPSSGKVNKDTTISIVVSQGAKPQQPGATTQTVPGADDNTDDTGAPNAKSKS